MLCRIGNNRLVADTDKCFKNPIANIIIRRVIACIDMEKKYIFVINAFNLHNNLWNRIYSFFYLLTDEFRVFFYV